jgi:hypothetical protein
MKVFKVMFYLWLGFVLTLTAVIAGLFFIGGVR